MREIKFKLWNKNVKSFIKEFTDDGAETNAQVTLLNTLVNTNSNLDFYEICQYTGLKDKNGKEIYEGDLLSVKMNDVDGIQIGQVKYTLGCFNVLYHYIPFDEERSKNFAYRIASINQDSEIVGNIFENPNLI